MPKSSTCPGSYCEPCGDKDNVCPVCGRTFSKLRRNRNGADRNFDIPKHRAPSL
jgi:hypothetical protein